MPYTKVNASISESFRKDSAGCCGLGSLMWLFGCHLWLTGWRVWSRLFKDVPLTLLASYPWVNPPQRIHGAIWVFSCPRVLSFPRVSSEGSFSALYDLAWEVTWFISTVFYWLHRFLMSFGRRLHKSINTRGRRSWGGILQVATTALILAFPEKRKNIL